MNTEVEAIAARTKESAARDKASVPTGKPSIANWMPAVVVWTIWSLMLLAGVFFVAARGDNLPFGDDFEMVEALTGTRPVTLSWLWAQHNEHRIFLPRLVMLALYKVSGNDFRAAMYFDVLLLAATAVILIRAAGQVRGRTAYTDAIFPVALLHWGHWENLIWFIQVTYVLPTFLLFVLLAIIVRTGNALSLGSGVVAGICLVLQPLCNGSGLPFVPVLAGWLGYWGVLRWRSTTPHGRRDGVVFLTFAVAALVLFAVYFVRFNTRQAQAHHPGLWASAVVTLRVLSMSLGPVGKELWAFSGLLSLALLALGVAALVFAWFKLPEGRPRLLGLFLFLAGIAGLALGMGWARAWVGQSAGFATRYCLLAVPALFWVYFIWEIHGGRSGRIMQGTLFFVVVALFYLNMQLGLEQADAGRHHRLQAFERDLRAGTPWLTLAKRYSQNGESLIYPQTQLLAERLALLCRARITPFQHLRDSHPFQGAHDHNDSAIAGWAWDRDRPNTPLGVEIYDGTTLLATILANHPRPDLLKRGLGNGKHGFRLPMPESLKDGKTHSVRVKLAGTDFELFGTPRSVIIAAERR